MPGEIKTILPAFPQTRHVHLHPAWYSFIRYCETIGFGEIGKLKIQDGLPMIAEEVKRKIKFTNEG
ncbi:MAG: hypothetical protein JXB26_12775 [Candidatus Aminicenantes bacterium]|nr:hypothetical protein [Candidatus Aminicenantes bacterium]